MPYPLGGTVLNGSVRFVSQARLNRIDGDHTASFSMENSIFPPVSRSVSIKFIRQSRIFRFELERDWGGIGGFIYIPSFPQLERNVTTYPHAF